MAQPPRPAANGDNFVRHVVPDPKNVPDVMLLYGYLGASSEEANERLYLSPDLSNYVEVPTASILHRAQSAAEQDSLGGVTLWVRKDAALKYKMAPAAEAAQQALAAYFTGAIQAGAGGAAAAPIHPTIPLPLCRPLCPPPTLVYMCRAPTAGCTHGIECQSVQAGTCYLECNVTRLACQLPQAQAQPAAAGAAVKTIAPPCVPYTRAACTHGLHCASVGCTGACDVSIGPACFSGACGSVGGCVTNFCGLSIPYCHG